jgi:Icc-related predicted phosphoesterase
VLAKPVGHWIAIQTVRPPPIENDATARDFALRRTHHYGSDGIRSKIDPEQEGMGIHGSRRQFQEVE